MPIAPIVQLIDPDSESSTNGHVSFDPYRRLTSAVWVFDIEHVKIAYANQAACELWQAENEEELCARDMSEGMSSTVSKRLRQYQIDFRALDAEFNELWTLYPNGDPTSVMVVFRGYILPDGRMAMLCEAVSEKIDEPENLRSAEALLHTDVMIALFGEDGIALYQNPAARNAYFEPKAPLPDMFRDPGDYETFRAEMERTGEFRMVCRVNTSQGDRWYDLSGKTCSDAVTGAPAVLLTAIDVSELKEAKDTARYLADRDQLTNLHNRSYLQGYLASLEERQDKESCAVIFFDIDRFKLINDRYGHEAGDTVLRVIARRARDILRQDDMLARLGGDEFVIIIESPFDQSRLNETISRLRAAVSKPIDHEQTQIDVAVSVGVSVLEPSSPDLNEVLREADIALYASKQGGRDRVTYFNTELGNAVKEREQLEVELKRAIEEMQFELYYQPRLEIATNKIVGVEGLVRWNHPERGLVMPNDFIPLAEETGLIEGLGRLVLKAGCAQAIEWHNQGRDVTVSLNVSPRQFVDDSFLETLAEIALVPDFPRNKIELEVTENVLIGNHNLIAKRLRAITAIGYRIAIDDFGTGYSNLSYISRFPLTCLKIDRTFIDQLPDSGPIVQLILTLAQQVGARVVSEGVETQPQMDWLAAHQCTEVQGFLITPALPAGELEDFARKNYGWE